jgi:hypothetical protein
MKKFVTALFLLCSLPAGLFAQHDTAFLEIVAPKSQPRNSLYYSISFLDSRNGPGFRQGGSLGFLGKSTDQLYLRTPVGPQLTRVLDSLTDAGAGKAQLLFQLRRFRFVEESSTRYCYLSASIYAREGEHCRPLSTLDTVIILTTGNIKKELTKEASKLLTDFIASTLMETGNDSSVYAQADIEHIDSIEEQRLPVYRTDRYADGVYSSFAAFASMKPDVFATVRTRKDGSITSVYVVDPDGTKVWIDRKYLYAVVSNGRLYLSNEYGYFPVQRIGNEFIFVGVVRVAANNEDLMTAQIAFGLIGRAIAKSGARAEYRLLIDHLNGRLVHLAALNTNPE